MRIRKWQKAVKRIVDLSIAVPAVIFLSPLFAVCAVLVRVRSRGPVIFRHARLGKDGVPFTIFKFRTMVAGAQLQETRDGQGANVIPPSDPRITPVGRILRATSLDELPQLFNVIRGDMSIVGPRPDDARDIVLYTAADRRKLEMKPGITSLAMIKGRNSIAWRERLQWEIRYVENYSLWLDFQILMKTIPVVLFGRGVFTPPKGEDRVRDSC